MPEKWKNWLGQIASWALSFTVFEQIGPATLLAVLLKSLGASPLEIGFLLALMPIGMATQALGAPLLEARRSRKWSLVLVTAVSSVPYLLMAFGIWALAPLHKNLAVATVLFCFALLALVGGVREVAFFELAGATIREKHRGRFFGLRDTLTAGMGMMGGATILWTLSRFDGRFPLGYVALLTGSFFVVTAAWISLLLSDDRARSCQNGPPSPFDLVRKLPSMLAEDRPLLRYLAWRTLIQAARSSHAFLIVFALARFSLSDATTGMFLFAIEVCRLIAGVPCGWITDRLGPRAGLAIVALASVALTAVAMVVASFEFGVALAYVMFGLLGVFKAMWFSADSAMVLKLTTPERHLRYVSLARLVPLPATLAAPLLTGFIANTCGYAWAFALGTALAFAAAVIAIRIASRG